MGALIGLFCIMAVVGSAIAIWLNTKFGKKWLEKSEPLHKAFVYASSLLRHILKAANLFFRRLFIT